MAINRTGSRRVVVDGVAYRWQVRRRPTRADLDRWGGDIVLAAERDGAVGGSVLVVFTGLPRDVLNLGTYDALTPRAVADAIRAALAAGWAPVVPGGPFRHRLGGVPA